MLINIGVMVLVFVVVFSMMLGAILAGGPAYFERKDMVEGVTE